MKADTIRKKASDLKTEKYRLVGKVDNLAKEILDTRESVEVQSGCYIDDDNISNDLSLESVEVKKLRKNEKGVIMAEYAYAVGDTDEIPFDFLKLNNKLEILNSLILSD